MSNWPYRIKYIDDSTAYEVIPRCSPSYLPFIANDIYRFDTERGMRLNPKNPKLIVNFLQFQPAPVNDLQFELFFIFVIAQLRYL